MFEDLFMSEENNRVSLLHSVANLLHVSIETFVLIVSVIFVVGFSLVFLKHMFFADSVKDVYMNWEDITYVSYQFDEKHNRDIVSITYESMRGFPKTIDVDYEELSLSEACPIILSFDYTIPTMMGDTLILPAHFDSVFGYVKEYNKLLREREE